MAGRRIIKPTLTIDGEEFKCLSRTVSLEPGDYINFCEQEWTCSIEVELSYDATNGSWNILDALRDQVVTVVLSPDDTLTTPGDTNPSATFDAVIPAIPFMSGATRGERMVFTLELMSESEPVFATA